MSSANFQQAGLKLFLIRRTLRDTEKLLFTKTIFSFLTIYSIFCILRSGKTFPHDDAAVSAAWGIYTISKKVVDKKERIRVCFLQEVMRAWFFAKRYNSNLIPCADME